MRPQSHYEAVLARRLDPDYGALHVLLDGELLPEASLGPWEALEKWNPMRSPLNRTQRARAASMRRRMPDEARAAGLEDGALVVPDPPAIVAPSLPEVTAMTLDVGRSGKRCRRRV